jgi:hypothetical protein
MARTVLMIVVTMLLACACSCADLMFVAKSEYELREAGAPVDGVELPAAAEGHERQSLPEAIDRVVASPEAPLQWLKVWMAEGKWRRDVFEQDPRSGCEAVLSVIRLEELGHTIMLDWQERVATISEDVAMEQMTIDMATAEQQAHQAAASQQMPKIESLPPELQKELEKRVAEMGELAKQARADAEPVITVSVEGPLENATVLGLGCRKYRITTETLFPVSGEGRCHSREDTWTLLTDQLTPPASEQDVWEWRGAMATIGWDEAWDQATADLDMPEGFPMKRYTVQEDLISGAIGVLQAEILAYDEAPIAATVFEIPAGFTQQRMGLPDAMRPVQP